MIHRRQQASVENTVVTYIHSQSMIGFVQLCAHAASKQCKLKHNN
jgi:hypothetical protein